MDDAGGGGGAEDGLLVASAPVAVAPRGAAPPGYLGHRARLRRRLVDGGPAALLDHELLEVVLFLDPRDRLLADEVQGKDAADRTPVSPREVVLRALEVGAAALVLVRNHPSGDPTPSRAHIETAEEVKAAVGAFGIAVNDHLIVGRGRHTSLRREGLL